MIAIEARSDPKIGKVPYSLKQTRETTQNSRLFSLAEKVSKSKV